MKFNVSSINETSNVRALTKPSIFLDSQDKNLQYKCHNFLSLSRYFYFCLSEMDYISIMVEFKKEKTCMRQKTTTLLIIST